MRTPGDYPIADGPYCSIAEREQWRELFAHADALVARTYRRVLLDGRNGDEGALSAETREALEIAAAWEQHAVELTATGRVLPFRRRPTPMWQRHVDRAVKGPAA